ncbi:hypothetical protein IFO70_02300 [Phormidium tenue FACHB-886]|nr:hypothetical protein [Phormidium tenue FACHB-886]
MTQDKIIQDRPQEIKQWLAEIKALQQKLAEALQERDTAYASAANWRSLYETEAKQRRTEAAIARQTIEAIKAELEALQYTSTAAEIPAALQQQIAQTTDISALQAQLAEALLERDRLSQTLRAEQTAHVATRQQLTTALGDAIDQLNRRSASLKSE